jgi:hypothetical protein
MIGAIVVVFLQVAGPPATPAEPPAAQGAAPISPGMMDCEYDRATRVRLCRTSEGEVLRCRRERTLGSRFSTNVCFTVAEDERIQRDSQSALDRQQRVTTPDVN